MNRRFVCALILSLLLLAGCTEIRLTPKSASEPPLSIAPPTAVDPAVGTNANTSEIKKPPLNTSWQIQYTGILNLDLDVRIFNLDLFETERESIDELHERGTFVMCYFSGGSYEEWRPDAMEFPQDVLGKELSGWPGERWLDIRNIDLLAPIMISRLDLAKEKGCDGVDPDNVNGFVNDTGFSLSHEDQLKYNRFLAEAAHTRWLSIGLKNDYEQAAVLEPYFDWALSEQCFYYAECELLLPFIKAGKPVFNIEYELNVDEFCGESAGMGINSIRKNLELDEVLETCDP